MNQCEVEDELKIESFNDDVMQECDVLNEDPSNMEAYGVTIQKCVDCGYAFNISPESDDKIDRLKKHQPAIDGGLNIEYRCSKCRDCSLCKKAIETERISLREEAEDAKIWDSVMLDAANNRIICTLPLRGKEEDFLTNNRPKAVKTLESQCKKYFNDEDTKVQIIKSKDKLLDNCYIKLFKDIPEDLKAQMLAKTVQNYIEWRVVFKNSISTLCLLVFDASSKTPLNAE